jgi:hypothetical protein
MIVHAYPAKIMHILYMLGLHNPTLSEVLDPRHPRDSNIPITLEYYEICRILYNVEMARILAHLPFYFPS